MAKVAVQLWEFTVKGAREFPFDMLRYDRCWPKTEAHDVTAMAPHHRSDEYGKVREVRMIGINEPTIDRWHSFGWKIDNIRKVA